MANDSAENDDVELEAMLKDSFSWHPCKVSLRSTGLGLMVLYVDKNLEEVVADKEGVLARVRVRSTPLRGDDCASIQQGDHVLATYNSRVEGIFYDAQVEKAVQVRHSKRNQCRCSFTIRWLHHAPGGEAQTVPASAIMKLARESINIHPTISAFFNLLESSSSSVVDTTPFTTTADGMDWEMDIDVLLERHIQNLNSSSDISGKKISQHFFFGLEVDLEEQSRDRETDASLKESCALTPLLSNLMQSTGTGKHQTETTIESLASIPSIQEEIIRSKSPLNPLAARAALASLRSKFPRSTELSAESNMDKEDITNKYSITKLQDVSGSGKFSAAGHSSVTYDLSVKIKNAKNEGIVKTLFPISNVTRIAESSNASARAQARGRGIKTKNPEKEVIHSSEVRLTDAQTQRSSRVHESTPIIDTKDTQLRSSSRTRKSTRSTVDIAEKTDLSEANAESEVDLSTNSVAQNIRSRQKSENNKPIVSPICSNVSTPSAEIEKSLLEKDGSVIKSDSRTGTFVEEAQKQNLPKRLTRSAAREETEDSNLQPKLKTRKRNSSQSKELNLSEGDVTPESGTLELEKLYSSPDAVKITSPDAVKITSQFTEDRGKNKKKLTELKTTPSSSESIVSSSQGTKNKSAASKKQETRFSPRLKFLPRTRSQRKA